MLLALCVLLTQDTARESPLDNSGTLGFTKKNELFVGRMAMLGFAVRMGHALTATRRTKAPIL